MKYEYHHSAYTRGYVSRKATEEQLPRIPYNGRFGRGYYVDCPCFNSTRYCVRKYYIEVN